MTRQNKRVIVPVLVCLLGILVWFGGHPPDSTQPPGRDQADGGDAGGITLSTGSDDVDPDAVPAASGPAGKSDAVFVDRAEAAGLHYRWTIAGPRPLDILQGIGNGCAFLDYDGDGNLDILLVGSRLALYKGDGRGHFTDVTRQMGLDRFSGHFLGCAVGDYDNDGYDDIYVSGWHTALLLHNEKGKFFRDVTKQEGLTPQPWGSSCAFADIDGDGRPDLYVGNYLTYTPGVQVRLCTNYYDRAGKPLISGCGPQMYQAEKGVLYRNNGRRFQNVTAQWGALNTTGKVLGAAFADFDGSGHPSLYLANDRVPSTLLKNTGTKFENIGERSGTARPLAGMGTDWGDYDNDGKLDLALATFQGEQKCIYHNEGSDLFEDASPRLGVAQAAYHYLSFGVKWFDFDNDGWLDLVLANGYINDNVAQFYPHDSYRQIPLLFHNEAGKRLADISRQAGPGLQQPIVGRGLAVGDYDNDGKVDLLIVDSEGRPLLLHNESTHTGHWLSFELIGTRCNRDAYGAQVIVEAGGLTQTRLCHTDGSYLSASDPRVHIGLGRAAFARKVLIRWPDGRADTYTHVPADRHFTVHEGDKTLTSFVPESTKPRG